MNKNDVVKLENSIVRILDTKDNRYLVIDCKLRNMCFWISKKVIDSGIVISEEGREGGSIKRVEQIIVQLLR